MESSYETFRKAIAAGVFIGMGCIAYLSCENKVIGAFLFAIGLCSVVIFGSKLLTGALCTSDDWGELGLVNLGNYVGVFVMALLARASGIIGEIDMSARVGRPFYENILRGIICEICIYIAVMGHKKSRKLLIVVLGVMAFILCGSEHCIADFFYILMSSSGGVWYKEILFVLLVTVGNIIGAAFMRWLDPYDDITRTFEF